MRTKLLHMTRSENVYEFEEFEKNSTITRYYFMSEGERQIVKIVEFKYVGSRENKSIYNLGFGTFQENNTFQDDDISLNGDTYKVFNTVLSTIPHFMNNYPGAMVMVAGSDSIDSYPQKCWPNCKKKCVPSVCKNANRRITIYKNFVNKNWELLAKEYKFWGGFKLNDFQGYMEEYKTLNKYQVVYFQKII